MAKALRILIADDEALIRLDVKEMLEEAGHTVVGEASDGDAAVAMAESLAPDLILMDMKMPNLDGLGALRKLNAPGRKRIPVVMATAFSAPDLVEQAVELGVFAYLVKPIQATELLPTLEVAIHRAGEMAELEKEVEDLKEALETRKVVERAKGLLISAYGLTETEAFRRLQKLSMNSRKPLREVAEAVLLAQEVAPTGEGHKA